MPQDVYSHCFRKDNINDVPVRVKCDVTAPRIITSPKTLAMFFRMPATKLLTRLVLATWLMCASSALANETTRVACLGDSITAGARVDPATHSYPTQLQDLLGDEFEIRNFGLGSATLIKTGRPNVWQKLDAVEQFNPHVVVISLGTNDTVGGQRQNWEKIGSFENDYVTLIHLLAALPAKPRIVLCTPTAMVLDTPGLSDARLADLRERKSRLQDLSERVRRVAREQADKNVSLLELNAVLQGKPELLTPQRRCPSQRGWIFGNRTSCCETHSPVDHAS